jgi:hypothetical protein
MEREMSDDQARSLHRDNVRAETGAVVVGHDLRDSVVITGDGNTVYIYGSRERAHLESAFRALADMVELPQVRQTVCGFQADFRAACAQIGRVGIYKSLHDAFQKLENQYRVLRDCLRRLPADGTAWETFEETEPDCSDTILELTRLITGMQHSEAEIRWRLRLDRAKGLLATGVERRDLEPTAVAVRLMKEILDQAPSRINAHLVGAAGDLRIPALAEALVTLSDRIDAQRIEATVSKLKDFRNGVTVLASLNAALTAFVRYHNFLQGLDDEVRLAEALLGTGLDVSSIADASSMWGQMIAELPSGEEIEWKAMIIEGLNDLDSALEDADAVTIRRVFRNYRSKVSRTFNRVDADLVRLCADLQRIGEPLALVLSLL